MEKGLFVGIVVGLILVFSIFTIGFYSGSATTGYFTLNFFKTNTNLVDQSTTEQVSEPIKEQTKVEGVIAPPIVKDTSLMASDGSGFNPCNTFNPVANFSNYSSGYEFCTKQGYNSCTEIRSPLLKNPSSCTIGIKCLEEPVYEYVSKIVNITETVPVNKTIVISNRFEGQVKLLKGVSNIIRAPNGEVLNITFKEFGYGMGFILINSTLDFCKYNQIVNNKTYEQDKEILNKIIKCVDGKPYNVTTGDLLVDKSFYYFFISSNPINVKVHYNWNHPFWSDMIGYIYLALPVNNNYYANYLSNFIVKIVDYVDYKDELDRDDSILINYTYTYTTEKDITELVNITKQVEITEKVQKGFEKKCYSTLDNIPHIFITCCNSPRDQILVEPNVPSQPPYDYEYNKPVAQPVQQKSSGQTSSQSQEQTSFFGKFANFFSF